MYRVFQIIFAGVLGLLMASSHATAFEQSAVRLSCKGQADQTYAVELALTAQDRGQGLMFRTELATGTGMLFDFGSMRPVAMWMRNTFVPLDMIFINKKGKVLHIHHGAIPHDETHISAGVPVRAVLEVPAGTAKADGLARGCIAHHAMFNNAELR